MTALDCRDPESGSVLVPCKKCGALLVLSLAGQKFVKEKGALVGCAKCIQKEMGGTLDEMPPVSPADVEQLIRESPDPERLARKFEKFTKNPNEALRRLAKGGPPEE